MIPRYSPQDVAELFSDAHRFDTMLEVELLAAEGLAEQGVVPHVDVVKLRQRRPVIDEDFVTAVEEREAVTNHDTAAFVDVVQSRIGMPEGAWIHYGLTSSDVVDTALCSNLTQAMDIVVTEAIALRDALTRRAVQSIDLPITGRTHGQHAEPTTYGVKFALFALQVQRDVERAQHARTSIAVGKLSGAVGTFSNIDPAVEAYVCCPARSDAGPGDPGHRARSTRRSALRLRVTGHRHRAVRARGAPPRAQRGRRGRRAVHGRPEGLVVDAAQAQPGALRTTVRARSGAARLPAGRTRGRRALARARHLALECRARRLARRPGSSRCTCCARPPGSPTAWCCTRNGPSRTSRPARSGSSSPSQSSLHWSIPGCHATTPTGSSSPPRGARVDERRNFREVIEEDDAVTLSNDALAKAFDSERLLTHRGRFLDALAWRS